jgi:hypothetical protein
MGVVVPRVESIPKYCTVNAPGGGRKSRGTVVAVVCVEKTQNASLILEGGW